jgi:molybdopterin/thiamine biosynthesis adenylyltransferase
MNKFSRIGITSCLFVAICTVMIVKGSKPVVVPAQPQPQQNDRRKEKLQRLRVQDFHGEAASLRAKQLRKLNKGVARAMKDAENRGLRQAFEHGRVILGTDPAVDKTNAVARSTFPIASPGAIRPASYRFNVSQDTFADGEYEVTFIPYDDGDSNTWEGIIYRFDPDWGDDVRYAVIDIQTNEPNVTQEIYYPPAGDDPQVIDPNNPIIGKNTSTGPQPQVCSATRTTASPFRKAGLSQPVGAALPCPPGWKPCLRLRDECCAPPPNINKWLGCAGKGCSGAGLGCSRLGPAWSGCWGLGCTGAMLLCLL